MKCKYVQYDFNNTDATVLSSFKKSFNDVVKSCSSVGILINNVGLSNETPEYLHLIPESDINQMLTVNNFGTILMSRLLLPHFVERKKGALVTVSSASCTHATPLLSCYSATKGFGNQLTRSMFYEYKEVREREKVKAISNNNTFLTRYTHMYALSLALTSSELTAFP